MEYVRYSLELKCNDAEGWSDIGEYKTEEQLRCSLEKKVKEYREVVKVSTEITSIRLRIIKIVYTPIEEHYIH